MYFIAGEGVKIAGIILAIVALMVYPHKSAQGIKSGIVLLYEAIVPSLFPFLVLSSYISQNNTVNKLASLLQPLSQKIFKINSVGLIAVALSFLGGYPVGAKTVCELYEDKKLTQQDAEKLFCWCINPGSSFVITAVGTFMIKNTFCGVLMFFSIVLSSIITGFIVGFFLPRGEKIAPKKESLRKSDAFINSVKNGNTAIISVMGWVILFSCINSILNSSIPYKGFSLALTSVSEVTNGCRLACLNGLPLTIICALLSFGGFAVIFQVAPYIRRCNISLKTFICWKIANSALSAFICSQACRIFPHSLQASVTLTVGNTIFQFNHSILTALVMILMCIVFVFEVDNRRKLC